MLLILSQTNFAITRSAAFCFLSRQPVTNFARFPFEAQVLLWPWGEIMTPEELPKIAEAIRSAHHQHLGIAVHPPRPIHAPTAVRLEHHDLVSFTNALDRAREQWPDSALSLIGAHGAVGTTNIDDCADTFPPGFLRFLDPEVLLPFPIDDPEADDQLAQ